jgi:uncharacterized protein (DUF305 family)
MTGTFARCKWWIVTIVLLAGLGAANACAPQTGSSPQAPFDQRFIDMMAPHHQGAIEMAEIAKQRAQHPEIKQMASAIIDSQANEIAQMKSWRKDWYGSDQTPAMDKMPMVVDMPGHGGTTMNMAQDVENLRKAGEPFDPAFIDAMIPHHQRAIDAAREAATRAEKPEIKQMAKSIITDQQREIDQMKSWRQSWFGAAPAATMNMAH